MEGAYLSGNQEECYMQRSVENYSMLQAVLFNIMEAGFGSHVPTTSRDMECALVDPLNYVDWGRNLRWAGYGIAQLGVRNMANLHQNLH
jgi:hypothetical protein